MDTVNALTQRPAPDRYVSAYLAMPQNKDKTAADAVKSFVVDLSPQDQAKWLGQPSASQSGDTGETLYDVNGKAITDPDMRASFLAQERQALESQPKATQPGIFEQIRDYANKIAPKQLLYGPLGAAIEHAHQLSGGRTPTLPDPTNGMADTVSKAAIVPQTKTGAVLTAAGGPLSKLGIVPSALGGAALGVGTEALTGGSPTSGAVQGGAGAVMAKAIPAAVGLGQKLMAGGAEPAAQRVAARLVQSAAADHPELGTAVTGQGSVPEQLANLVSSGPKVLSKTLQQAESAIASKVPQIRVPSSEPASGLVTAQGQQIPGPTSKLIDTADAFQQMKVLNDRVSYLVKQRANGTLGRLEDLDEAKSAAETFQNLVTEQLQRVDPNLSQLWQQAITKYGHGARWLELADSSIAGKSATGTPFDPGALAKAIRDDLRRYLTLPSIRGLSGGEVGTQPVTSEMRLPLPHWLRPNVTTEPGRAYGMNPAPLMPALTNPSIGGLSPAQAGLIGGGMMLKQHAPHALGGGESD